MKDVIKLRLTKIAAATCKGYFSNCGCLVATALKRRFPAANVQVGGDDVRINGTRYDMSRKQARRVANTYDVGFASGITLEQFKPFTLRLTRATPQRRTRVTML